MQSKILEVAIVGLPNCGKSTLVNSLMNNPTICTVSSMAHTTKRVSLGSFEYQGVHIILYDTPGLSLSKHREIRSISNLAKGAIKHKDLCIVMFDALKYRQREHSSGLPEFLLHLESDCPKIAVINKIDRNGRHLLPMVDELRHYFDEVIPISALNGAGVDNLLTSMVNYATRPNNQDVFLSNLSPEQRILGFTQAAINENLDDELPHRCEIELNNIRITESEVFIYETIHVSSNHYPIFVGHIKSISQQARQGLAPALVNKYIDHPALPENIKKVHLFIEISPI